MVCVVKVAGVNGYVPACGTAVQDGMEVQSDCGEVSEARRAAIELLLSDHVGDCMGPCQMGCPAHMDIPQMIRHIAAGRLREAVTTVKRDIALPAVLGRICPAPCENVCRRAQHDEAVSICLLKRHAADVDLQGDEPYLPDRSQPLGKRVAIVGAGPAGLAAAYYLQADGFDCTVFDDHEESGGMLRYGVPAAELPRDVLSAEIACIERLGVRFRLQSRVGVSISVDEIRRVFDAVFLAVGQLKAGDAQMLHLPDASETIKIDSRTYETGIPGVFAGGDAVRRRRLAVRSVADGKEAAQAIRQYLLGEEVVGADSPFNSRMGKLQNGEIETFVASASGESKKVSTGPAGGFTDEQGRAEARRCLHCDCRKPDTCLLRRWAKCYGARQARYKSDRRPFAQDAQHPDTVYEPGKCIDCGTCIQIAGEMRETLGLTFVGRGFDVRVGVPLDGTLAEGLRVAAAGCVDACPTGALAFRDRSESGQAREA
jgi:NADPH-dependent glutamate synthase beta subunit-like oxidoreductase